MFLFLQHKKEKNKKCNFLFEYLIFDNPKFCKKLFWHTVTLFVFSKKNLDQFLTYDLDQFLTYKTPNLGPVFNFTAYIYIYASNPTGWAIFRRENVKEQRERGKTMAERGKNLKEEEQTLKHENPPTFLVGVFCGHFWL